MSAISTAKIDSLRAKDYISEMKSTVKSRVENICSLEGSDAIKRQIDTYFRPHKKIGKDTNKFLNDHPHVFSDLIRVIHKYRINDNEGGWYIPDDKFDSIQQIFLFRNRTANIGKDIPSIIHAILKNEAFIAFCSEQQSILDVGSHDFSLIPENKRKSAIKKLITTGLVSNIEGCSTDTIDTYFSTTKAKILDFLNDIYGTEVSDLKWCKNIDELSKKLNDLFGTKAGNDRKRAWKVIQAFHAWGDIIDIESRYNQTKTNLEHIPKRLRDIGIEIDLDNIKVTTEQGTEIYTTTWNYKGQIIIVSWRAKSIKSMLKKLWETEEYIRSSAVRDELGFSFVYSDSIPQDIKKEIMLLSNSLMPDKGYILKNKGELDDKELYNTLLNELKRKPLFESNKPGLDPKMRNASQSGFTKIGNYTMGCEVQYSTATAMERKKKEDPVYKLKGIIDALMRGANQASPKELFDALTREIPTPKDIEKLRQSIIDIGDGSHLEKNKCVNHNDIMLYLLNKGDHIHAFSAPLHYEGIHDIAFLTTETHVEIFKKKWSSDFTHCTKNTTGEQWNQLNTYISGLKQTH